VAEGQTPWKGKLGRDLTTDQGYEAAKAVGLSLLTNIKAEVGDLDKVKRVVKLLSMINCDPEFGETPKVANGCSDLFISLWGENGKHGRSAVGMGSLPNGIPVEIEGIFEVSD
jgi:enamine deaminase RidA (YjgF/YER057c/UK114 family)